MTDRTPAPQPQELTIGDLLNQYFDQGRTGKHDEKADAIRLAIAGALQKIRAEADDETYEIGKRDGYSEAVQDIDQRTGGDGEYRYCLGMEDDVRHQPDPATMIQRIVDRFEVLNLLDDATKTGRDQPDDTPAPPPQEVVDRIARRIYEDAHRGMKNVWPWDDSGLDDEHPTARARYLGYARSALAATEGSADAS